MSPRKSHLIGAYGLFWDRDEVDWTPGQGHSWQLLGRIGHKRGKLRICDFRRARGFYVLFNDHRATYVGLAKGQQGFGARLVKHTLPTKQQPQEMRYAAKDWNRFCWFSFDDVQHRPPKADPYDAWCSVDVDDRSRDVTVDEVAPELEALMISALGIKGQNQMRFRLGGKWEQVTWNDCHPGGPLTKIDPITVTSPTLKDALEQLG